MANKQKRERLIESASWLFHERGVRATSLADIAKHADIPLGNVYYYFKTKEDLALAALQKRKEWLANAYIALEGLYEDPRLRLIEAIRFFDSARDDYTAFGCPIGKIIVETSSLPQDRVALFATSIFEDFILWCMQQFSKLGHDDQARNLATSLMVGIQGSVIMARAYQNSRLMSDEILRLCGWIESLPNRRITLGKVGMRSANAA